MHTRSLPGLHLVRDYHDAPGYIAALAASVREHWGSQGRGAHLLLSFHGIPEVNVRKGDPYARQCERTARLLADELGLGDGDWTLAYQSRFGRQRWLMPYTNETLHRLLNEWAELIPATFEVLPLIDAGNAKAYLKTHK